MLLRTRTSSNVASATSSRPNSSEPAMQARKPSGTVTIAGLPSGNGAALAGPDHTCGERMISTIAEIRPVKMPTTVPAVVSRRQIRDSSSAGKFADAATANVEAGEDLHVERLAGHQRDDHPDDTDHHDRQATGPDLLVLGRLPARITDP